MGSAWLQSDPAKDVMDMKEAVRANASIGMANVHTGHTFVSHLVLDAHTLAV